MINIITGHHYLIACIFLIVLGTVVLKYQYKFSDRTCALSASMAGLMHPMVLLLTEVNTISAYKDLCDEVFFAGTILEIIFMVISLLSMPCLRRKKLKTPAGLIVNLLIVLGYYSFGMIIGLGIRQINLSGPFNSRPDSFPLQQAVMILLGALVIYLSTFKYTDKEWKEDADETFGKLLHKK